MKNPSHAVNVLLVTSKLKSMYEDPGAVPGHPHTGMAYLGAFLKQHGVGVSAYEETFPTDRSPETVIRQVAFDLVGVTASSYSLPHVYATIDRIRRTAAHVPILIGGPHISVVRDAIFQEAPVDFAVKYEGEFTLLELLLELVRPKPEFRSVRGR